jgi:transposase
MGRIKTPAARREQLVDEFERSGLSGCKFAELAGIKYSTFATWVQKRRRKNGTYAKLPAKRSQRSDSVRWLEAVVQEAQDSKAALNESIILELRGGG